MFGLQITKSQGHFAVCIREEHEDEKAIFAQSWPPKADWRHFSSTLVRGCQDGSLDSTFSALCLFSQNALLL